MSRASRVSSDYVEIALQFPVGNAVVEATHFPLTGFNKVTNEGFTKQLVRQLGTIQRLGLASAPGVRVSRRIDLLLPGITRNETLRLSIPQVGLTGARLASTKRL